MLKDFGVKFLGIPVTSVKPTTCINDDVEMEIEEGDGTIGILNFDEIKSIDPMRIIQTKPFVNVRTDRKIILEKFSSIFLGNMVDK